MYVETKPLLQQNKGCESINFYYQITFPTINSPSTWMFDETEPHSPCSLLLIMTQNKNKTHKSRSKQRH